MLQRNFGLDLVRSLAILMTLISHAKHFFLPHATNPAPLLGLSIFGMFGVELFFVLSGFLIGQILIRELAATMSLGSVLHFYSRRWLRTLPAYYLILIILLIFTNYNSSSYQWHWKHFIFSQNFFPGELAFFGVSWSLSVEEWFYLLTPLLFASLLRHPSHAQSRLPWIIAGLCLMVGIIRYAYVLAYNPSWDAGVRKLIPLRFDSLFLGIGIAWVKLFLPDIYRSLGSTRLFSACLIGLGALGYYFFLLFPVPIVLDASIFARTWSFSFVSLLLALTLPYFEQSPFINLTLTKRVFIKSFITHTSLYAYMIYLIHLDIFIILFPYNVSLASGIQLLIFSLLGIYLSAALLYHHFEKPFMDLRDKLPHR